MDKRIIWFAVVIILIGGALFFFRYNRAHTMANVNGLNFTVKPQTIKAGDSISFEDNTDGAQTWKWEFGDAGGKPVFGSKGFYRFYDAGRYTLKLTVNGRYTDSSTTIIVNPRDAPALGAKVAIEGPDRVFAGDEVTFRDNTPGASHTNWTNTDNGETKKDQKTYTTIFMHKGDFQIIAENELNSGSDGQAIKRVHVMLKPVSQPPQGGGGGDGGGGKGGGGGTTPQPVVQKKVTDPELQNSFKAIVARQDAFRSNYQVIKNEVGGDESVEVVIEKSDGTTMDRKLFGGCQYLNMMQMAVNKVTTERDATTGNITKIIVNVN